MSDVADIDAGRYQGAGGNLGGMNVLAGAGVGGAKVPAEGWAE